MSARRNRNLPSQREQEDIVMSALAARLAQDAAHAVRYSIGKGSLATNREIREFSDETEIDIHAEFRAEVTLLLNRLLARR